MNGQLLGNLENNHQIGILLATYCEAPNIERLINEIQKIKLDTQILVIDDSSPDKTAEIVRALQEKYSNIILFIRPEKSGLGTAITDGFRIFLSLKYVPKFIVTMDADYSHNPKDIPLLVSHMLKEYGLVIGSRYCKGGRIEGWPIMRRIISRTANILARSLAGLKLNDCTSGFRCYSTEFLKAAIDNLHCTTFEIQIETVKQARLQRFGIDEIPVLFANRKRGKSKLTFNEVSGYFLYILKTIRR
jgi:dolichol-phosphate mannosyltransferase